MVQCAERALAAAALLADPTVCLMGEDVGHYGGSYKVSYGLYKKFGEMRLLDTPICGACGGRLPP